MSKKRSDERREQRRRQTQRDATMRKNKDGADAFAEQLAEATKKMESIQKHLNS